MDVSGNPLIINEDEIYTSGDAPVESDEEISLFTGTNNSKSNNITNNPAPR
ncbi:hypothetical protein QRE66_05310 [Bacillus cereus]|nr:hypothetical protein QRE66_05310 [Bacillus cereus]